jgi:methyl-accepting chemotaxis protein
MVDAAAADAETIADAVADIAAATDEQTEMTADLDASVRELSGGK